jgi:cell division protein FtsB
MISFLIPMLLKLGLSARWSKITAIALPLLLVIGLAWLAANHWQSQHKAQLQTAEREGQLNERLEQNNEVFRSVEAAHHADAIADPVRDQRLCEKYDRNCKVGQ